MDPETEMKKLLEEVDCIDAVIDSLEAIKKRKYYKDCLDEISDLIDKLKDKKKMLKDSLDDLMNELVAAAEVYKDLDFSALDGELQ